MKKGLINVLIVTFCICAFLGIFVIILDLWNDLTAKVLLTTFVIFCFSITSLCCSILYEKKTHNAIALTGLIVNAISCLYILGLIFGLISVKFDFVWTALFSGIIFSVSFSHICLLLLINSKDVTVNTVKHATITLLIILVFMIMCDLWGEDDFFFWQFFAIAGILIALGTVVTPLLHKMSKNDDVVQNRKNNKKVAKGSEPKLKDLDLLLYLKNKGYILDEEFKKISSRIDKKDS